MDFQNTYNPSYVHASSVTTKNGPNYDIYWTQTNQQTDTLNIYIEGYFRFLNSGLDWIKYPPRL